MVQDFRLIQNVIRMEHQKIINLPDNNQTLKLRRKNRIEITDD